MRDERRNAVVIGHTASGLPIFLIAGGSPEGGDGGQGGNEGGNDGGEGGKGGDGGAGGSGAGGGDKTFTQAELDRIVSDRLKREREKFGDVDDLRQKAQKYDELEASQKTELQKATDATAAEKERADKAEARYRSVVVEREFTRAAAKVDFIDPDDAYRLIDADDIEYDDSGRPKNAEKLLTALAKSKPHLVRAGGKGGSGDGGLRGGEPNTGTDMNAAIRRAAGRPA